MIRSSVFLIKSVYFTPDGPLPLMSGENDSMVVNAVDIGQDIIYDVEHVTSAYNTMDIIDTKEIFFRTSSVSYTLIFIE